MSSRDCLKLQQVELALGLRYSYRQHRLQYKTDRLEHYFVRVQAFVSLIMFGLPHTIIFCKDFVPLLPF